MRSIGSSFSRAGGVVGFEVPEARGGVAGRRCELVGRKVRRVVVVWEASGSFDCVRRKVRGGLRSEAVTLYFGVWLVGGRDLCFVSVVSGLRVSIDRW